MGVLCKLKQISFQGNLAAYVSCAVDCIGWAVLVPVYWSAPHCPDKQLSALDDLLLSSANHMQHHANHANNTIKVK